MPPTPTGGETGRGGLGFQDQSPVIFPDINEWDLQQCNICLGCWLNGVLTPNVDLKWILTKCTLSMTSFTISKELQRIELSSVGLAHATQVEIEVDEARTKTPGANPAC